MSDLTALFARVVVRHRGEGLLRLQLPASLCRPAVGRYLILGLEQQPGVRRVRLDLEMGRLAIHYQETTLTEGQIAHHLAHLLRQLQEPAKTRPAAPAATTAPSLKERLLAIPVLQKTMRKVILWRAQATAIKLMIGEQMESRPALQVFGKNPETAVINFINEIVTFYLIRTHWTLITQVWLRQPLRHYKEWLTLFYLVFLLVRSRRGTDHTGR